MSRLIDSARQAIKRPKVKYFLGGVGVIIAMSVISLVPLEAAPTQPSSQAVQAKPAAHKTIASGEVKSAATSQPQPASPDVYTVSSASVYRSAAQPAVKQAIQQPAPQQQPVQQPVENSPQPVQPPSTICRPIAEETPDNLCTPRCGAGRMCPYCSGTAQDYSCVLIEQNGNSSSI